MNTATKTGIALTTFNGHAEHYKLSEPLSGNEYVIVSAVNALYSGPETYIFGATEDGEVADWLELHGSYRGGLDHAAALSGAGYEVA
ncbi:hypothetical protein [Arthrobacter bambusae]|uniref:hypothetical protein n=1 Tax=Arthrobacter bambusae TaxID=1338426 RepID=UPI0027811E7D|nr:hypothetical protein [Arthrobacter bambusae]MDQ0241245.1 hypothetical protein [Arthrobacter bambusae]